MNFSDLPKDPYELLIYAVGILLQAGLIYYQRRKISQQAKALPAVAGAAPSVRPSGQGPTIVLLLLATGTVSAWTAAASKGQIGQLVQRARGSIPMEANGAPLVAPPAPESITPASACPDCPASCSCNESSKNCKCPTREGELAGRPSSVLRSLPWFNEPINPWAGR